jgi:hypothetical protein
MSVTIEVAKDDRAAFRPTRQDYIGVRLVVTPLWLR